MHRVTVKKRDGTVTHALADDAATLAYLAGQNVVTPHVWLSRADEPRKPDRLILDFDPSGGGFAEVRAAARDAGDRLRDAGLVPYAMVTGSRGVHVVCPLRRGPSFTDVHGFARRLAEEMVRDDPRHLTLEWRKADRGDLIFVDVNRNAYAQHAVAPYGVRAGAARAGGHPAALGGALGEPPQAGSLDGEDDRRARGGRGRPVEGDGAAGAQAACLAVEAQAERGRARAARARAGRRCGRRRRGGCG